MIVWTHHRILSSFRLLLLLFLLIQEFMFARSIDSTHLEDIQEFAKESQLGVQYTVKLK